MKSDLDERLTGRIVFPVYCTGLSSPQKPTENKLFAPEAVQTNPQIVTTIKI